MGKNNIHVSVQSAEENDEDGDMIPSNESEMVAILHEILGSEMDYYNNRSLEETHGQQQYFKGVSKALNITLKEIFQIGPAKGLMRIKKIHRKRAYERIKQRKTENLPFDAGLIDGFDEAAERIVEMTYPLYVGGGFSKDLQMAWRAEDTFAAEERKQNADGIILTIPIIEDRHDDKYYQNKIIEIYKNEFNDTDIRWDNAYFKNKLSNVIQFLTFDQSDKKIVDKIIDELKAKGYKVSKRNKHFHWLDYYGAESFAAEGNKMKAAILRGIQAAVREEYANFDGKADIAATVNMILRELGQIEGDVPVEMLEVGSAPAMRMDPYDVVAAMAKAANQMDTLNEADMVCWDLPDMFLDSATKRLGWGLQSVFGIHALSAKVEGKPSWRVSGNPQAIETWFMLYNSLRINLENEMKGIKSMERAEQFYQAFTKHIRENDNVAKMIEANSDYREEARALSIDCFPPPEITKFIPVEDKIEERAKRASNKLEPFGAEKGITESDYVTYAYNNPEIANKLDTDDMKIFVIGVAVGTIATFLGNILSDKFIKNKDLN